MEKTEKQTEFSFLHGISQNFAKIIMLKVHVNFFIQKVSYYSPKPCQMNACIYQRRTQTFYHLLWWQINLKIVKIVFELVNFVQKHAQQATVSSNLKILEYGYA